MVSATLKVIQNGCSKTQKTCPHSDMEHAEVHKAAQ